MFEPIILFSDLKWITLNTFKSIYCLHIMFTHILKIFSSHVYKMHSCVHKGINTWYISDGSIPLTLMLRVLHLPAGGCSAQPSYCLKTSVLKDALMDVQLDQ